MRRRKKKELRRKGEKRAVYTIYYYTRYTAVLKGNRTPLYPHKIFHTKRNPLRGLLQKIVSLNYMTKRYDASYTYQARYPCVACITQYRIILSIISIAYPLNPSNAVNARGCG